MQRPRQRSTNGRHPAGTAAPAAGGSVVPYEYAAEFQLGGRPGATHDSVINVMPDAGFVATAIGYGFEQERTHLLEPDFGAPDAPIRPGDVLLGEIPEEALLEGFRVNPAYEPMVFTPDLGAFLDEPLSRDRFRANGRGGQPAQRQLVLQHLRPTAEPSFYFSIIDTATGRELQDLPVHNLAALGRADGARPFRPLAQPLSFLPRSTLRVQVREGSVALTGTLFIVLFGYAVLGLGAAAEPAAQRLLAAGAASAPRGGDRERVVPFDYAAVVQLEGRPGRSDSSEIHVGLDGQFVATAIGYGLDALSETVRLRASDAAALRGDDPVDLAKLPLRAFQPRDLLDGVRVRPEYRRMVFDPAKRLATVRRDLVDRVFESMNRPADVSFRYNIVDGGTGRPLQNRPIHSVAGLGAADGRRPFKRLARPLAFRPRSTIRVEIAEHFGRGTLYVAFHGYKVLGDPAGVPS